MPDTRPLPTDLRCVVVATDFSDSSVHAAKWVARFVARNATVVLVHVVELPDLPRFIRARFPQIAGVTESAIAGAMTRLRAVAAALPVSEVQTEVRVGAAAEQIAALARELHADLVVVARHGDRPGLMNRLGTTADRLVRISAVPVLLATGLRDTSPRHILAALDDADVTPHIVDWTRRLAARFDADVTAMHVVRSAILDHIVSGACVETGDLALTPAAVRAQVSDEGVRWLQGLFAEDAAVPRLATEVTFGWIAREIVAAAERKSSELIVLGRAGSALGRRLLLGSVTRQVLHHARCPVLVVIEPERAAAEQPSAA